MRNHPYFFHFRHNAKKFGCENNRKKKTKNYKLLFVDNLHIAKKVEFFFFFGGTFKKISIVAMFIEGKMG